MRKLLYILLLFILLLISCNQDNSSKKEIIIQSSEITKNNKEDLINNYIDFDFKSIQKHYSESNITSGRTNKPELTFINKFKKDGYYGFYNFIDFDSIQNPHISASAIVSFNKLPWTYSDNTQHILICKVFSNSFKYNPFSIRIGDNLNEIELKKIIEKDNIYYYRIKNLNIAVQTENEIIKRYAVWFDEENSNNIVVSNHNFIKEYLK